ncbi:MAG TPA: (2Fe-2S)-binding protein [Terrimesophilobacter sp.]|nr:(2Fe-2S)-binding protein [Terrimesophilobacter sp.]
MAARMLPSEKDPIQPSSSTTVSITVDGHVATGILGQSIAGIMMAGDRLGFRQTAKLDRPRGVFCGIGVCFDCLVEVNGLSDVRACQRKACDGDVVVTARDPQPRGGAA